MRGVSGAIGSGVGGGVLAERMMHTRYVGSRSGSGGLTACRKTTYGMYVCKYAEATTIARVGNRGLLTG